ASDAIVVSAGRDAVVERQAQIARRLVRGVVAHRNTLGFPASAQGIEVVAHTLAHEAHVLAQRVARYVIGKLVALAAVVVESIAELGGLGMVRYLIVAAALRCVLSIAVRALGQFLQSVKVLIHIDEFYL